MCRGEVVARWGRKGPAAARSRAPTGAEWGAGRDARGHHTLQPVVDSPARGSRPGDPRGSGLRPAPPAARLRQDQQASAHAATGPSGAPSAPPGPPARAAPRPGSDARAHVLPEGRFHSYPLQDPPKHGLASRRRRRHRRRRGVLSAPLRGLLTTGGREGRQPSREGEGRGRGGGGRGFGGPDFPTGGERLASTSQRGGSQRALACRAAPVTDSWAGPPAWARGAEPLQPRLLGLSILEEGGAGGGPARGFDQSEGGASVSDKAAGSWCGGFFRRALGPLGAGPCSGVSRVAF